MLRRLGYKVRSTIGTNSHILYFCSAPFGRSALIVQDEYPDVVNATLIEADQDLEDVNKCIVQDNAIILTYPGADYVTCYSCEVDIEDDEYYTVTMDAVCADAMGTSLHIDHYFVDKSKELFSNKFDSIRNVNQVLTKLRDYQEEAMSLNAKIEGTFKKMHSIRDKSLALMQNNRSEEVIPLNVELRDLLTNAEDLAENYRILAQKIVGF